MSIKIALAGNPNSGKTTLFNALTGSNQYVGNWPGVTVEKKSGRLKDHGEAEIVDLPGIYSLTPYTPEETAARDFLTNAGSRPDVILNIIDGMNLERNLFLTTQLLELGIPVVIAVNMMDIVDKNGVMIDIEKLSDELGCPAAGISALKNQGVKEMANIAIDIVDNADTVLSRQRGRPLADGDLGSSQRINDNNVSLKNRFLTDEDRYAYVNAVVKHCTPVNTNVNTDTDTNGHQLSASDKIDRVVTNRWLALPLFAAVMFAIYFIAMTTVGAAATEWANEELFGSEWGVPALLGGILESTNSPEWLRGLLIDGVTAGVGAVLGFVPQIFILFILLAFLEGCGYMARAAFIMDRFFQLIGLSGKSFIPFLIGTGCSVPAIMAARTIEDGRARRMTVIVTSFIPCSAKLPIIAMVAGAMFSGAWWVAPSAYFVGIAAIVVSCVILQKLKLFAGDAAPFVMELPAYRWPRFGGVVRSAWERGWSFVKKAGTIILFASMIIWFASNFGFGEDGFGMVDMGESVLAKLGGLFAWVFAPLGWGSWQAAVAAITGLAAKENIVGTLGVLYGFAEVGEEGQELWSSLSADFTALSAYSFLLFNLLCIPCFAAVGAIRREMESGKWLLIAIGYQCAFAYAVSLCVYQLGMMFAGNFGAGSAAAVLITIGGLYMLLRNHRRRPMRSK